jgi:hypothetical protein
MQRVPRTIRGPREVRQRHDIWARLTETCERAGIELAAIEDERNPEVAVEQGGFQKSWHGQNLGIDLSAGMLAKKGPA